jgi:hypothetical protein
VLARYPLDGAVAAASSTPKSSAKEAEAVREDEALNVDHERY